MTNDNSPIKLIQQGFDGLKIKKVKHDGEGLAVAYKTTYPTADESGASVQVGKDEAKTVTSFPHKPHQTLMKAFDNMRMHVVFIFGFLDHNDYDAEIFDAQNDGVLESMYPKEFKIIDRITFSGYTLGGADDEGVVLTANMLTHFGRNVVLNTPFHLLTNEDYTFMEEFENDFRKTETEVFNYMNGKRWFDGQLQFDFADSASEIEIGAKKSTPDALRNLLNTQPQA